MAYMFKGAVSFNQDLSAWDVTFVTDMTEMFNGATSFSQTLCGASWRLKDPNIVLGSKGSIGQLGCTTTTITTTTIATTTTTATTTASTTTTTTPTTSS